ncbi:relaxase/mobilization nuclease domain-containing protein [Pedobacter paludis]|uniref:Relaxase n=1 Tax=Pedobacter paludis TaxID=2203212 RepID=A0A317F5N2_9SPHI|nr:relaxase/mobilization nuclease domain-containing protein [Pedobacter paludis]PWS33357.1 relaxase [Pedobacter paludis]
MVAKIITGKSIRGALLYNENKVDKGDAQLILASGFAGEIDRMNVQQKLGRFRHLTDLNARAKTNTLHISLNFHADDSLSNDKLRLLASGYMEGIGFGDQPFLVYRHNDSAHPHVHIISTNIQRDGNRISLHDIGKNLSEPTRKALEIKYDLVKAEGRENSLREALKPLVYGERPTRRAISNIVSRVSREYAFGSFAEYKAVLSHFGVHAERGVPGSEMFEKRGLQYFAMDAMGLPRGVPVKASSIYARPTMNNLEKRYLKNVAKKQEHKPALKRKLDELLVRQPSFDEPRFPSLLGEKYISPLWRKSDQGTVYGLTYIDHELKVVMNGSELGKAYSAKAITARFGHEPTRVLRKPEKIKLEIAELERSISPTSLPLLELLTKADNEPLNNLRRKKRRKSRSQSNEIIR